MYTPGHTVEQTVELLVIWNNRTIMWYHNFFQELFIFLSFDLWLAYNAHYHDFVMTHEENHPLKIRVGFWPDKSPLKHS